MSVFLPLKDPLEEYNMKRFYNCILSQTLSDSGKYIFAGNCFGDIFVFEIQNAIDGQPECPKIYPQSDKLEISCLTFHRDFLIVGAVGIIYGLKWLEEKRELSNTRTWEIRIPLEPAGVEVPDVNCLSLQASKDRLYVGCAGNTIYEICLEEGRIVRNYHGHKDYIHSICSTEQSRLYSASHDGCVYFWSISEKNPIHILEPYKNNNLERPENGKWIGSVAANDEWLICGGGPKLSLWHLNSLQCTNHYPFPKGILICDFVDHNIFVAGQWTNAQFYSMNGDLKTDVKTQNSAIYSAIWQLKPERFMSIAGFSNELSILKDFRFIDFEIEMYTNKKGNIFDM